MKDATKISVACSLSTFFGVAARRSAGFLYVAILHTYNATRSEAAWAVIIMTGIISLAGLISGPIAHKYTARPVTLVGGFIAALGLMLCYFATRIEHLIMSLGILHAIGSGLVFVVIPTVINEHFVRYRGLAMGINFAGSTMATFVFPKMLEVLTDTYGFRAAMLMFGAVSLNSVAFSLFLRQPAWLKRHLAAEAKASEAAAQIASDGSAVRRASFSNGDPHAGKGRKTSTPGSLRHALTVFSCPMFYVVAYSYIAFIFACECYISLLVDFAADKGISFSRAITMLSLSSVADLVGRLTLPLAADRGYITRQTLLTVTFFNLGTLFVLLPLASSYAAVFAFATAIAFFIGVAICLFSVLLAEYVGLDRVSMAYGMVSGFSGVTSLFKPLIIGYFRDHVGAYDNLFIICGSGVIVGGFIWMAIRFVHSLRRTKRWIPSKPDNMGKTDVAVVSPKYICDSREHPTMYVP
ncbi:hypothetical protein V5799_015302 [Amblyomma americanum]|uniref:Major facilitator superfamily (MFS) profile domain-containing protein n=1 Tax=Amblyomma americanum TaxID=6943 RepID=A0AAQ4E0J4_AMBAM